MLTFWDRVGVVLAVLLVLGYLGWGADMMFAQEIRAQVVVLRAPADKVVRRLPSGQEYTVDDRRLVVAFDGRLFETKPLWPHEAPRYYAGREVTLVAHRSLLTGIIWHHYTKLE